ncbi:IclR family transcriptional regulator (plasmid) [Aminobacter sp. P9b]|uniref:IclR family acetate operon transcriptional repressor n=1 Tax=Aminobacter niigataensis TaxID=83265 RepID=A0ABR6L5X0_9HYPH|nr:IclR family acetate operon transcriptional repressor [Aminobacter niigataensis]
MSKDSESETFLQETGPAERKQDTSTSLVLANGLDVLSLVAKTNGELSLREIGHILGLSSTVTHRLVATLRHRNFLEKNPATGKYIIGIESYRVGQSYTETMKTEAVAKPILQEAGQRLGVNCFLGVRKDTSIVYLYDFSAARRSSIRLAPGTEVPLVATAMGLSILADLSEARLKEFKDRVFQDNAVGETFLAEFDAQIEFARKNGYALIRSELFPGVVTVGAKIAQGHSDIEAAISFGLPSDAASEAHLAKLGESILATARRIEQALTS